MALPFPNRVRDNFLTVQIGEAKRGWKWISVTTYIGHVDYLSDIVISFRSTF